MAINSNVKRVSVQRFLMPFAPALPLPDSSVDAGDRATISWTYYIVTSVVTTPQDLEDVYDVVTATAEVYDAVTATCDAYDVVAEVSEVYDL